MEMHILAQGDQLLVQTLADRIRQNHWMYPETQRLAMRSQEGSPDQTADWVFLTDCTESVGGELDLPTIAAISEVLGDISHDSEKLKPRVLAETRTQAMERLGKVACDTEHFETAHNISTYVRFSLAGKQAVKVANHLDERLRAALVTSA